MKDEQPIDVCLILEGTYPYVAGGVSSWVHSLITQMSELRFAVMHLSSEQGVYARGSLFEKPDNLLWVREIHLFEYGNLLRHDVRRRLLRSWRLQALETW